MMAEIEMAVAVKEWETDCSNRMFEEHIAELICVMKRTSCPGKEVFLKELISFSTTRLEVKEGDGDSAHNGGEESCINVLFDGGENRLTVEDGGTEISEDDLGMRPKKGTKALISSLKAGKDLSKINLLDVGFFTVFAVADKITINSTHSGRNELFTWKSSATERGFTIKCTPSEQIECRCTQIILDLKEDVSEKIKTTGFERFIRQHNCHSSYKINIYQYSVMYSSEKGHSEPEREAFTAADTTKDVRKCAENTRGKSKGKKNPKRLGSKTKASSSTTAVAGLGTGGPPSGRSSSPVFTFSIQKFGALEGGAPHGAGQKPPGIVSPGSQLPLRAGLPPGTCGPPSGSPSSTVLAVQTQRFGALKGGTPVSAGQRPPGIVSPGSQGPLRTGLPPGTCGPSSGSRSSTVLAVQIQRSGVLKGGTTLGAGQKPPGIVSPGSQLSVRAGLPQGTCGPPSGSPSSTVLAVQTQRFGVLSGDTRLVAVASQKPPEIVSPGRQLPVRAGLPLGTCGPPSGSPSSTVLAVQTQRFGALKGGTALGAGQKPPGIVSPGSQGPLRAGLPPGTSGPPSGNHSSAVLAVPTQTFGALQGGTPLSAGQNPPGRVAAGSQLPLRAGLPPGTSGPSSGNPSSTVVAVPTQRFRVLSGGTPLVASQKPPGIVSPGSQLPVRAGLPPGFSGPPSGNPSSTVVAVQTQRFGALKGGTPLGAGQKPPGIVSPGSQLPLRTGLSPGSVQTIRVVKGTTFKRKSTGGSPHYGTPKARKGNPVVSTISPTSAPILTNAKPITSVVSAMSASKTSTITSNPSALGGNIMTTVYTRALSDVNKCKDFLDTLIRLSSNGNQPPQTIQNVKDLVKNLIDGVIQPEEFVRKLTEELKSTPQPSLVPFFEKHLPSLRQLIQTGRISPVHGITPNNKATTPGSTTSSIAPVLTAPKGAVASQIKSGMKRIKQKKSAVITKSPDNQGKGAKRKSAGPSLHETPKSRKSTVSSDVSAITPVVANGKQNHVAKVTDHTFRDCTNLDSATPKTPGSANTPGMSRKFISTLGSVKNRTGENVTIAVKVMRQKDLGKEKPEADGKAWYRGSWEIVDSTDRAILKVYGMQDMQFFQPRQQLLLQNIWIKEDHIAFTKFSKVEKYTGEIKTVEGIDKKRRSDEAKNRMTLEEIKTRGCKAAARLHIYQVGDVQPYRKKDDSESYLKKLQVKDQKNSKETYELVTFHDIAGFPYEVNKRYHFPCITYNRDKGNFQTIGQTLPHVV